MTLTLRPDQLKMYANVRQALRDGARSPLLVCPTGWGKTIWFSYLVQQALAKGGRIYVLEHRAELIDQVSATLSRFNVPHSYIAPGYPYNPYEPVQVASVFSLARRLDQVPTPTILILDEAHHAILGSTWSKIFTRWPKAIRCGVTATACRLSGEALGDIFDTIIVGPSTASLIGDGLLSPYRAFAPSSPDMSAVHSLAGDWKRDEAEDVMDKPTITGDAITHYKKYVGGKRAIAFCVSVKHSQHVAETFRDSGVMAWHIDGTTNKGERAQAIAAFRRGEIKVLCNVDLISEGFDTPAAEAALLLRPTKSLGLYLQQCGRVLRTAPGKKHALIMDHANLIRTHGFPDDERQWTLEGRQRRKGGTETDIGIKECPICYAAHRPAPKCPECGFVYEINARVVEQVDGELSEVDIAAARHEKREAQWKAQTLEELIAVGRQRGYRSPEKWAAHLFTARLAKRKVDA